jgi:uncharacterized protein (TIGR01244 family)
MKLEVLVLLATALAATGCASDPAVTTLPPVANALVAAPGVVVAGRLQPGDLEGVSAAGIRHVIDLTPDVETPGFDEAEAVRAAGITYSNLPLRGAMDLTRENVLAFDALLRDARRPLLVHCASGNRVGAMAALRAAWVEGRPAEEALAIGRAWGLKGLEGDVRARIESDRVDRG